MSACDDLSRGGVALVVAGRSQSCVAERDNGRLFISEHLFFGGGA
jgi:hypothetical protein